MAIFCIKKGIPLFCLLIIIACNKFAKIENKLERNLSWAGNNRPALEQVLNHYKNPSDSLRLKAAKFLIENLETLKHKQGIWVAKFQTMLRGASAVSNDSLHHLLENHRQINGIADLNNTRSINELKTISAEYLIQNIDEAFYDWQNAPWKKQVSFDAFCNYILPYKISSETPEKWRTRLKEKYQYIMDNPAFPKAMEDICCAIVNDEKKWFKYTETLNEFPQALGISDILEGQRGDCAEMANLAAYSARALGIPVAIDYTPQWSNNAAGHIWNALILNDSSFLPFLGAEGTPGDYINITRNESRPAKIFRKRLAINEYSFAAMAKARNISEIPLYLQNPRIQDKTADYVLTGDISISNSFSDQQAVYLCLFGSNGWQAIAGTFAKLNKAVFKDMGRDAMYMPMLFENNLYQAKSDPIILKSDGTQIQIEINKQKSQSLHLLRKYPLKKNFAKWTLAQYLINARFEGSNSPDFKESELLYFGHEPFDRPNEKNINGPVPRDNLDYESLWEHGEIKSSKKYRYLRFLADNGAAFKLGELRFYTKNDSLPLIGKPIGNVPHPEWAFDGVPGYSIIKSDDDQSDRWVGLDLEIAKSISHVRYLPTADHNKIIPDKTYELFYWSGNWVSVGKQKAEKHVLEYSDIPSDGLYWLHCTDCNSAEERPFTYSNGKQIWW